MIAGNASKSKLDHLWMEFFLSRLQVPLFYTNFILQKPLPIVRFGFDICWSK